MRPLEKTIQEILDNIPTERKEAFHRLHHVIVDNLPEGFEVGISYGMLGYVVPHSIYPAGYHCKKKNRSPFASLASQKNSINLSHGHLCRSRTARVVCDRISEILQE